VTRRDATALAAALLAAAVAPAAAAAAFPGIVFERGGHAQLLYAGAK
jgi:hypothetical protein